jgi:hypothetical protein
MAALNHDSHLEKPERDVGMLTAADFNVNDTGNHGRRTNVITGESVLVPCA